MIEYPVYYKKFGVRRLEQMVKPMLYSVNALFLPFNSLIHYYPDDNVSMGIPADDVLLQHYKRTIFIDHVKDLVIEKGTPRPVPFQINNEIMKYHRVNKKARIIKDIETVDKDKRSIIVINHALAPHKYKYMESNPFSPYNEWHNRYRSLWLKVNEMAQLTQRNQFIEMKLPVQLPPVSLLMRAEKEMTRNLLDKFDSPELLMLLDFWTWMGDLRKNSLMGAVAREHLSKVNIVWLESGRWVVLNLGVLDAWRDVPENKEIKGTKLNTAMMQKRFLRFVMSIQEAASVAGVDVDAITPLDIADKESDHIENADAKDAELPEVTTARDGEIETIDEVPITVVRQNEPVVEKPFEVAVKKPVKAPEPVKTKSKMATGHDVDLETELTTDKDDAVVEEVSDVEIDKDLEELEKLTVDKTEAISYKPYTTKESTLEAGIIDAANRIAKTGMITAAEHRRFVKLASRYKEIANPYTDKGTLEDLTVIKPEEVAVAPTNPIADEITGVLDKSMLSSSMKDYDKQYLKNVLPKDTVSMVLNIQKAGIAVQNYNIEKVVDVNDEYELHTVKLVPVVGSPSTIKFRLPSVDENGVFRAGNVKYRLRRQRSDLPIRKISPSEVALTSYYSKLFVNRSERAIFNYANWLLNEITSRGIDSADMSVTDIRMANVFDHEADVPKVYSTLATRFAGFVSGKYEFFFDYSKRIDFFTEKVVNEIEGKKVRLIPIAKSKDEYLMMDWKNQIHAVSRTKVTESALIGDIEKIIGINKTNRPNEIAEIQIFAKAFPIAFVLGHEIGLGNLIATLGATVRRVGKRERYEVSEDEFTIAFNDEVLIVDRKDKVAALILGSLNRYHRDLKKYSVYLFDQREVYQSILEANSLGARYPREFDLMFKMWVDHITKEILEDMKEPTDLVHLLIRACELLVTDKHPSVVDNEWMRDKGYERLTGMMYAEMVKAIRVYQARPANATATVDLNPNAVWNAIAADPTTTVIEESNPIHNLKEKEVVVYRGSGGRTSRSMTAETRVFHKNSMGVISEATTDNADVGTIVYLTADPNYKSLRGTVRPLDKIEGNAAKLVSPSMLLAFGAENDDRAGPSLIGRISTN